MNNSINNSVGSGNKKIAQIVGCSNSFGNHRPLSANTNPWIFNMNLKTVLFMCVKQGESQSSTSTISNECL